MVIKMAEKISGIGLRKDMLLDRLLLKMKFSMRRHNLRLAVAARAQENLELLERREIHVRAKDVKLWARYVNRFATYHKEEMLAYLQEKVDYDLKEYLDGRKGSLWGRYFKFLRPAYMDSDRLIKKYRRYIDVCREMRGRDDIKGLMAEARKIRKQARKYAAAVVNGKISVKPEDYQEHLQYFSVICYPPVEGDFPDLAKKKIKALQQQSGAEAAVYRPAAVENEKSEKRGRFAKLKFWALGGIVALAGCGWGVKSCSTDKPESNPQEHKTEITTGKSDAGKKEAVVVDFAAARRKAAADSVQAAPVIKAANENTASKERAQKIWRNYYDNTVEILSSAKTKERLYQKIERQLADGVFVLPQEISKERLAYTYLIYKAYGINSTIGAALEKSSKLSEAEQTRMVEDVLAAGAKGEGVKKTAQARSGGQLGTYSRYDHASRTLQQRHIRNLQSVHQLRKHQAR